MFEIIQIIFRVLMNYLSILITFRIMGKREIGELSIIDLVIFLMIAEVAALSIENLNDPLYHAIIITFLLAGLQKLLSYLTMKDPKLRDKIEGKPSVIIANGKINYQEMSKQQYSFDDLMQQLRDKSIRSISEVEFAILEVSGTLSVFKKNKENISPLPIIISGQIVKENFSYIDIDETDLITILRNKGYNDINKILYANYENKELFIVVID